MSRETPCHLRPVIMKPVGRIFFSKSAIRIRHGENTENAEGPLILQKQGSEETPRSKNAENADTKTRKMRKCG